MGSRLVVTSGIHQAGRFLQGLLGLIALLGPLALAAAGTRAATGDAEGARTWLQAVPVLAVWTVVFGPFALWRNRVVLDRAAGTLTRTWGFPGWTWGRRDYDLAAFRVDDRDGALPSRRVGLSDGRETVTLRIFAYELHALRLARRVAEFLGQELRGPAREPKVASYLLTRILLQLSAAAGLIAGVALFFVALERLGPRLPTSPGLRMGTILFLWAASPLACIAVLSSWAPFVPVGCPRCGGRARLKLRWMPHYACRDCGSSWRHGTSRRPA